MGMSTHAIGFKPADDRWNQMKEAWDSCNLAHLKPPAEVIDFFNDVYPGDKPGMEVELGDSCKEWSDYDAQGYQIEIDKLPNGVKFIRVYNSY